MMYADQYVAFQGPECLQQGGLAEVLTAVKAELDRRGGMLHAPDLFIFEEKSGRPVDFDFRGEVSDVLRRAIPDVAAQEAPQGEVALLGGAQSGAPGTSGPRSGPGRPKLGVVAREVTLLPRHWDWLESQPKSTSAVLRELIDEASRDNPAVGPGQADLEAVGRVMTVLAGDRPQYEAALRALYARKWAAFQDLTVEWPAGIRSYLLKRLGVGEQEG